MNHHVSQKWFGICLQYQGWSEGSEFPVFAHPKFSTFFFLIPKNKNKKQQLRNMISRGMIMSAVLPACLSWPAWPRVTMLCVTIQSPKYTVYLALWVPSEFIIHPWSVYDHLFSRTFFRVLHPCFFVPVSSFFVSCCLIKFGTSVCWLQCPVSRPINLEDIDYVFCWIWLLDLHAAETSMTILCLYEPVAIWQ